MKLSLLSVMVLLFLLPSPSSNPVRAPVENSDLKGRPLLEYSEPGQFEDQEPLPIKQIIGIVVAGLASLLILLFVFSFLMGPGEKIRAKMSERTDPFLTIVAILLVLLFLAMLQTYYNELLAWLKTTLSSG